MISVKTGIRAEEIRHQHVLFVEGDQDSIDPKVLNILFDRDATSNCNIRIEPLGPSHSVRSAAKALSVYHPTYYFLIDRDHHEDKFIDDCWSNFPNPTTHNLLIWRRREIENYFLEPNYLSKSKYCQVHQEKLENKIIHFANERLFLDVAKYTVISICKELKDMLHSIGRFSLEEFRTRDMALEKLKNDREFEEFCDNVNHKLSFDEVERRFSEYLLRMTGGQEKLKFGHGDWLNMIQGKPILKQLIQSDCFKVQASNGDVVNGQKKLNEIVKELLKNSRIQQPDDFVRLMDLINRQINKAT